MAIERFYGMVNIRVYKINSKNIDKIKCTCNNVNGQIYCSNSGTVYIIGSKNIAAVEVIGNRGFEIMRYFGTKRHFLRFTYYKGGAYYIDIEEEEDVIGIIRVSLQIWGEAKGHQGIDILYSGYLDPDRLQCNCTTAEALKAFAASWKNNE